ncbi:MAG: alkaline phosphatase family protein [Ruminococcaceae bacterium]|nr:alkaline phosphatase family protein [Oscillospiraceae bacterium]
MNRKLIIISNDALVREDIEYLKTKPCIREIIENGSFVESLRTVYPSITYCCHAAMITGAYPDKTGVHNNELDALNDSRWTWEREHIKVKTLIDAFKEKGLKTANVFWPVLGNDANIDYNIPEYWSQSDDDPLCDALSRMGTSDEVIENIVKPNLYYIEGHQRKHPYADEFVFSAARDILLKYKPDLLVVHPAGIDSLRHSKGIFNDYVTEQLDYTYYWIEKIVRAVKENGDFENTDIILTSDHGQMDVKRWCHPNILLRDMGLLDVDESGTKAKNAKAYIKAVGGSAQIFICDKDNPEIKETIYNTFKEYAKTGMYGFERIYTKEEAAEEERLSGDFEFVLESDGYTAFGGRVSGSYYTSYDLSDYRTGRGAHGYHPDKGPQPCMIMYGPDFKKGIKIGRRSTLDMAATVAKIFDLDMPDMDGKPIDEAIVD